MRTGFRYGIRDEFRTFFEPHLLEYIGHLRTEIGDPPNLESARELAQRLSLDIYIRAPGDSWSTAGKLPDLSDFDFHRHRLANGQVIEIGHGQHRLAIRLVHGDHTLLLVPHQYEQGHRLPLAMLFSIALSIGLIALAYHLVKRLFRPLDTLRDGIRRFGAGQLDHRIHINRRDELGELALSINAMADDIQQMLEAKRQLLLAVSHELRSPLTRARVTTELLPDDLLRQRIINDLREIETQLTELLETERLGNRHAKLDLGAVSPGALIKEVIESNFSKETFELDGLENDTYLSLDLVRIRLMIRNLLENARRYTPSGAAPPVVSSRIDATGWMFSVRDHGVGIAAEHLPHLTEPFYRVDKARQRDTGGYGLGLYLCRVIAQAHGGRLEITSTVNQGTEVKVVVPVSEQPESTI
jgi:signal transduction histidine kinase